MLNLSFCAIEPATSRPALAKSSLCCSAAHEGETISLALLRSLEPIFLPTERFLDGGYAGCPRSVTLRSVKGQLNAPQPMKRR